MIDAEVRGTSGFGPREVLVVPQDGRGQNYDAGSAPPVTDEGPFAVQVRVLWGDDVLCVRQLAAGQSFWVGSETGAGRDGAVDFVVPVEFAAVQRWQLVNNGSKLAADATLCLPPSASGTAQAHALTYGTVSKAELAGITFEVSLIRAEAPPPRAVASDHLKSLVGYFGASALSTAGLLGAMAFFVPPMGLNDGASVDAERLYLIQQYLSASAEQEQEPDPTPAETEDPAGGQEGAQAAGEQGALGKPTATKSDKKIAIKGPADNAQPELMKLSEAATFGMIGLLNSGIKHDGPSAPWARDDALGSDPMNAFGNMWGDELGDTNGAGGLSLLGTGEGGGGRYRGIGLGEIGTIGTLGNCDSEGPCTGLGNGFGAGHGRLGGSHKVKAPNPRIGVPKISGRLPPHTIQRIVRQNFGRMRHCYEQGLMSNPTLEGRVSVRFLINREGSVSTASGGGSSLPDSSVVSCVTRVFYGLSFPPPSGGTVTVNYPIMFSPG